MHPTILELYKNNFVALDYGYIIEREDQSCSVTNPTPYSFYKDMNVDEIKSHIAHMLYDNGDKADGWDVYASPDSVVIKYMSRKGDLCVGAFKKIKDKFQDCEFINETDKSHLSSVTAGYDIENKPLFIGDFVVHNKKIFSGRVIWKKTGFFVLMESLGTDIIPLESGNNFKKIN